MIKEYKRTCNECHKIWHSLESREKEIEKDIKLNATSQAGFACCSPSAALQAKRNVESNKDLLGKLKKCPQCGSGNYKEEAIVYEKK